MLSNTSNNTKKGEIQYVETPQLPFEIVPLDHFGPMIESRNKIKHILVLAPTFNAFGNPNEVVTDRGTAFSSRDLLTLWFREI